MVPREPPPVPVDERGHFNSQGGTVHDHPERAALYSGSPCRSSPAGASTGGASTVPNLLPVVRELPADLETPVSIYLRLAGQGPSFLLESITGGEQVARYSFIGVNPSRAYVLQGDRLAYHGPEGPVYLPSRGADPLDVLRGELGRYVPAPVPGLPRFAGGLAGYLSYDVARYFEPSLPQRAHETLPDAVFLLADTVVAFDHAYGRLLLIANVPLGSEDADAYAAARAEAEVRLDALQARLAGPLPAALPVSATEVPSELQSNMGADEFTEAVPAGQRAHRGRRYLPGRALAALLSPHDREPLQHLSCPAPPESLTLHVLL